MVGNIDEILGKKDKIILLVMLLCIVGILFLLNQFGYFENKKRDLIIDEEFSVKVIDQYFDKNNHMANMIKLSNNAEMINYFPRYNFRIEVGDSLSKQKNSTNMEVFRNNKMIISISLLDK